MSNPASLTAIVPQPRTIRLAGIPFLASEYRVKDVADLQAWIEGHAEDSFEDAAPRLLGVPENLRDRQWKLLLWRVVEGLEADPASIDSPEGGDLLNSPAGRVRQLVLSLRRERPDFDEAAAMVLLPSISADEWSRLVRLAWGASPRSVVRRLIDGEESRPGSPPDWSALWCAYVNNAGAAAPPFETLTLTQLRTWIVGGNPDESGESGSGVGDVDMELAMAKARHRAGFWAEIADEVDPQPEASTVAGLT